MVVQTIKKHFHRVLGAFPGSVFIAFLLKRAFPKSALAVRISAAAAWPVELRESVSGVQWRAWSGIWSCGAYWGSGSVESEAFSECFWIRSGFGAFSERFSERFQSFTSFSERFRSVSGSLERFQSIFGTFLSVRGALDFERFQKQVNIPLAPGNTARMLPKRFSRTPSLSEMLHKCFSEMLQKSS